MDFRRFHAGMEECRARHQCYFIDACQVGSDRIVRNAGFAGIPVIEWSGEKANPDGRTRLGPIFYSTMPDQKAYARAGQESVFTGALLEALAGGGSGDESGDWNVQVGLIQHALTQLRNEVAYLAVMATGKLLDENMNEERHRKVVHKMIEDFSAVS